MECKAFFQLLDGLPDAKHRGNTLREQSHTQLVEWQSTQASEHSPHAVRDDEVLRLALFECQQVEDGKLSRKAFSPLEHIGLSTDRGAYATVAQSHERALQKATRDGKPAWGHVEMRAADLRSIRAGEPGQQAIGIYDTAVPPTAEGLGNLSHAEAFLLFKTSNTVPMKSIQMDLRDAYKDQVRPWASDLG